MITTGFEAMPERHRGDAARSFIHIRRLSSCRRALIRGLAFVATATLFVALTCTAAYAQRTFPLNAQPRIHDFDIEPIYHGSVELGDYDGDGDLDVLVAGRSGDFMVTRVYCQSRIVVTYSIGETVYYDTVRTYIENQTDLPNVWQSTARWSDYDSDGDLDVLISGRTTLHASEVAAPITRLYERRGNSYFRDERSHFLGVFGGEIAWGDYDGDGDFDVLVIGSTRTAPPYDPATRLYRNDDGVFRAVTANLPDVTFGAAAWSDIDGDGDLDLALQGVTADGSLLTDVFRNDGDGRFERLHIDIPPVSQGSFDWGDVDGDGDDDLLVTGGMLDPKLQRGLTAIYLNEDGAFRRIPVDLPEALTGSAKFADFDLDGRLDIAVAGASHPFAQPTFSVYLNNGNGFDAALPTFGLMLGDVAVGDYNGDGDPDVLVTGRGSEGGSFTSFYQNHMVRDMNLDDFEGASIVPDVFGRWSGCIQGQ